MNLLPVLAVLFGVVLLASALHLACQVDRRAVERAWVELRVFLRVRRAWWLGPLALMLAVLLVIMCFSVPACAARLYSLF